MFPTICTTVYAQSYLFEVVEQTIPTPLYWNKNNPGTHILITQGSRRPTQIPALLSYGPHSAESNFLRIFVFSLYKHNTLFSSTFTFLQLPLTSAMLFPEFPLPFTLLCMCLISLPSSPLSLLSSHDLRNFFKLPSFYVASRPHELHNFHMTRGE